MRLSYAAFSAQLNEWSGRVKRWRCSLSVADRARLGLGKNWRCGDVTFLIDRPGFDPLGPARAGILDAVPTRCAAADPIRRFAPVFDPERQPDVPNVLFDTLLRHAGVGHRIVFALTRAVFGRQESGVNHRERFPPERHRFEVS